MAKSPKESNTGLVVTLVFFILSTLGLGVSTYMGFAEQKKNLDAAKDAETKKKDSDDRKRLYAAEAQLLYKYITNKDLPIEAGDKMEIPGDRQVIRDKAGWASKGVPGLEEALAEIENTQGECRRHSGEDSAGRWNGHHPLHEGGRKFADHEKALRKRPSKAARRP